MRPEGRGVVTPCAAWWRSSGGRVAGALTISEYRTGLLAVGFTNVEINPTHPVADAMHSAIVKATKP